MSKFCNNCGLCCMHMRTPPFLGPTDPQWKILPKELQFELLDWIVGENPRHAHMVKYDSLQVNPCLWLDLKTGACKHYDLRPNICRDYEVGNESCRILRKNVGLTVRGMSIVKEREL